MRRVFKPTYILYFLILIPQFTGAQGKRYRADDLFELGERAYDEGNYKEALDLLNKCLIIDPRFSRAYFTRGSAKERLNDLHGALTDYSVYLDLKPDHSEAMLSRAQVRYKLGYYKQAEEDFLRLLTLPPGETTTVFFKEPMSVDDTNQIMTMQGGDKSFIYNYLGLSSYKLKNFGKAVAYFDSAILLQKKDPDYFVNRGLAKQEIQDSTARLDYERALAINHNHTLAMNNLAALNSKKGNKIGADELLVKAIESDTSMLYPYLQRALQRFNSENYKGALEDYNRALKIDTTNVEIWVGRGLVKERLQDSEGAYGDYTKALDLDERNEKAWLNRANVLGRLGHYKEAIEDYTVVITYNENSGAAYYNRAMARQQLKQNTEACEDLVKAAALGIKVDEKIRKDLCGEVNR